MIAYYNCDDCMRYNSVILYARGVIFFFFFCQLVSLELTSLTVDEKITTHNIITVYIGPLIQLRAYAANRNKMRPPR